MVQMNDVKMVYGNTEAAALNGISFTINEGEFVFLVGPSGSGKTTIIKLITGELSPTSGQITVNGFDMQGIKRRKLPKLRRTLGVIFQDFRLFPEYTVQDNILTPFYLDHRAPDEQMLHKLTGILGIAGKLHSRPAQLSGGQQQRVAIARALIAKPRIVFADEPTGNLDTRTGEDTMRLLMECAAEFGQTLIVVTHNPEIAQKAQKVIRIEDGQILRGELQHEKGNLDTQ